MKAQILKISDDLRFNKIGDKEAKMLLLDLFLVIPRSFGMVRWYENIDEDVACVSIEKAEEYVEKYNKLAGEEKCYVDKETYLLANEV